LYTDLYNNIIYDSSVTGLSATNKGFLLFCVYVQVYNIHK